MARDILRRSPISSHCTCFHGDHVAVLHSLHQMSCLARSAQLALDAVLHSLHQMAVSPDLHDYSVELHSLPWMLPALLYSSGLHALVRRPCWTFRNASAQLMPEIITTGGERILRSQDNPFPNSLVIFSLHSDSGSKAVPKSLI